MAVKEAKIKLTLSFEIDEETLRDMFDNYEYKFTKKKAKELQEELDFNSDQVQIDMEERFQEIVEEWLSNQFDE